MGQSEDCSPGGSISDSSERLLQRSSGGKSIYKVLVKGEFNTMKHSFYTRALRPRPAPPGLPACRSPRAAQTRLERGRQAGRRAAPLYAVPALFIHDWYSAPRDPARAPGGERSVRQEGRASAAPAPHAALARELRPRGSAGRVSSARQASSSSTLGPRVPRLLPGTLGNFPGCL